MCFRYIISSIVFTFHDYFRIYKFVVEHIVILFGEAGCRRCAISILKRKCWFKTEADHGRTLHLAGRMSIEMDGWSSISYSPSRKQEICKSWVDLRGSQSPLISAIRKFCAKHSLSWFHPQRPEVRMAVAILKLYSNISCVPALSYILVKAKGLLLICRRS